MLTGKPQRPRREPTRLALATREGAAVASEFQRPRAGPEDGGAGEAAARPVSARLMETLSRLLRSGDTTRSEARQHHAADLDAHARTQALIRELGALLEPAAPAPVPAAPACPPAAAAPPGGAGFVPALTAGPEREVRAAPAAEPAAPSIEVYLLGPFRVFVNDGAVEWPPGKGKALFKYLALQRGRPVPREVLMDIFWPEAEPEAARNNLNVAIYGLRKTLARFDPDYAFVLFRHGEYSFNPALPLWVDAEAFASHVRGAEAAENRGETAVAMAQYRVAQAIYRGPLLVEDRYERWLAPQRQTLRERHVKVLERLAQFAFGAGDYESCVAAASRLLEDDACNEEAHRLMMRCFSRLGQAHLALRQYHLCIDALQRELKLIPSVQTVALSQEVRQRRPI